MNMVALEKLCAELVLAEFEIEHLVDAGVLCIEDDGRFDIGWCRLAVRAFRLQEPAILAMLASWPPSRPPKTATATAGLKMRLPARWMA